ncbi:MAG: hypothetical protein IJS09_02665 [Treponema sp.]|nr:hypothetical protein [Treponema sp.]
MKKILATGLSLLCAGFVFAGGIENKTNMSTGYLRNPSRNTEHKRPEAAFYNIAGTAFMKDGLYIEAGNQFIIKEYKNTFNDFRLTGVLDGKSYNDETFVYLYPNADIVFKHDKWAAFANFGIYAGGGKLEYSEGTSATSLGFLGRAQTSTDPTQAKTLKALMNNHSLTVTSITYGWQVGGAFAPADFIALACAFRLTYGTQELELAMPGTQTAGYNASAIGISGVFGVHAKPIDKLDVSAQFAWRSKMNYEVKDLKNAAIAAGFGITEGKTFRTDLSPVLNAGVGYQVLDPLYISTSFNFYFNNLATMNSVLSQTDNDFDPSFEIALGGDYDITKMITASMGVAYGKQGVTTSANNVFNPVLDSFQVGAGVEVRPIENLAITGGATWVKYFEKDYSFSTYNVTLSKPILLMFSLGATYRFPL